MWVTTIERLQRFALRKFHVTDGQNMHDQITSDKRSKRTWSHCVMCIPFILSGSPNECWLHTCDAYVITTWRLGLRAPLVTCKKFICQRGWPKHKHKKNTWFSYSCVYAYAYMSRLSSLMQKLLSLMLMLAWLVRTMLCLCLHLCRYWGPCYAYMLIFVSLGDDQALK